MCFKSNYLYLFLSTFLVLETNGYKIPRQLWKRYLSPPASQNSSNPISNQQVDTNTLCTTNYPDRFFLSSSLNSDGCQVMCSFFGSSSAKYRDFTDSPEIIIHYSNDHVPCGNNSFCLKGKCVDPFKLPGRAELTIISGYFPDQDLFSETDAYIKIDAYTTYKTRGFKNLGSTKVVEDRNYAIFDAIFTSPLSYKDGYFVLNVYDRDSSPDDFIKGITINFSDCPESKNCTTAGSKDYINYSLKWYPESYPEILEKL